MLVCRAGGAEAGCEGIPALLGLGSCAGSEGSLKEIIPSDLVPGMGCSLGKSQKRGTRHWLGGFLLAGGGSMRRCKSSKPAWRKNYFLFFDAKASFFLSLSEMSKSTIWQARKPNPITKMLKSFKVNYFTSSLLREILKNLPN